MNTVAIDLETLDDLFEKQKKMDELFDSIFDNDKYVINSSYSSPQAKSQALAFEEESQIAYGDDSAAEARFAVKIHIPYSLVLSIALEIAAIYFIATKLL